MATWDVTYSGSIERAELTRSFRFGKPADFAYVAGQYAVFTLPGEPSARSAPAAPAAPNEERRHHFTLSSSPTEPFVEFTTRMTGSPYKRALEAMAQGTRVRLGPVRGRFTLEAADGAKVAFITGGIGVTPARSMIRWAADTGTEVDIVLLLGNRDLAAAAFAEELDELDGLVGDRLTVVHCLEQPGPGWAGPVGRIGADLVRARTPDHRERTFYVCGPPAMVTAMRRMLVDEVGVADERVVLENFSGY